MLFTKMDQEAEMDIKVNENDKYSCPFLSVRKLDASFL